MELEAGVDSTDVLTPRTEDDALLPLTDPFIPWKEAYLYNGTLFDQNKE